MDEVTFYFDLLCPWAYQTSKWMREVQDRYGVPVRWRFFSLEERNWEAGRKHPWERDWSYGWSLLRVAAAIRRTVGDDAVGHFYATIGARIHEQGAVIHSAADLEQVLGEEGLDPAVVGSAIADAKTHDEVLLDHRAAVDLGAFGVPTLQLGAGDVLFGPVVVPAPLGSEADKLWDLVRLWAEFPHLYELQRPKDEQQMDHIRECFAPFAMAPGNPPSKQGANRDA